MLEIFLLSLQCAVCAYVYCEVLILQGHILYPFWRLILKIFTREKIEVVPDNAPEEVKRMPGYVYHPIQKKTVKRYWPLKILGECLYCTTGQLTLWTLVTKKLLLPLLSATVVTIITQVAEVIFSVCLSILFVLFLKKIYERWSIR